LIIHCAASGNSGPLFLAFPAALFTGLPTNTSSFAGREKPFLVASDHGPGVGEQTLLSKNCALKPEGYWTMVQ
jgi:hypothetical protein